MAAAIETPRRGPRLFLRYGHLISLGTDMGVLDWPMLAKEKQMKVREAYDLTRSPCAAVQLTGRRPPHLGSLRGGES